MGISQQSNNWSGYVLIQGKPPDSSGTAPSWPRVGPHYFQTIGTRSLQGRLIDERDRSGAPCVAVVNDAIPLVLAGQLYNVKSYD